MKLASFIVKATQRRTIGLLVGDKLLDLHEASDGNLPTSMIDFLELGEEAMDCARAMAAEARSRHDHLYAEEDVELQAPVPRPGKIMHTSCNFGDHLSELTTWSMPEWQSHNWGTFHFEHPTGFLEAPSAVVGSGHKIVRPAFTKQLDHEVELAIVIGKKAHRADVANALDYVAGYTVFNDLSARDIQAREHANKVILLGKSFDTSCPLGPYLVTRDEIPDPSALRMLLRVNGKVHQKASTSDMVYKPDQLVAWWSNMTLEPGDVITSGSPPGVIAGMQNPKWLEEGDIVEAEIENIGVLRNEVAVET